MRLPYDDVHLIADPLYGYLRITLSRAGEIAEPDVIDNPWVQRLKRIHQLQSSWWVFPTAEHSRFSHSLGTMHLAGQLARQVYPTLAEVESGTPSLALVEETLRMAGLLHDLGHGPFSHFCDEEYLLPVFGVDHEQISQRLIVEELGPLLAELRRSPSGPFASGEAVDPQHVAFLVRAEESETVPRWVRLLHRALSGAVTVDNLDYVRRDAQMCGVGLGPIDVDRLIYYTFCTDEGLTFHKRALSSLRAFLNARFYMYENVYFHRIGHAIDLHLREIFRPTLELVLPASPLEDPGVYRRLTEWSLFTTVESWLDEPFQSLRRELAEEWQSIIHRHVKYSMVYEHHVERQQPLPAARDLTREEFRAAIVRNLPPGSRDVEFVVDIASQDPRPLNPFVGPKRLPVYDPATDRIEEQLLTGILEFVPAKAHLYRVFAVGREHERELALAARAALGEIEPQSPTNL
ncbi:MAG: HD domain-containing protein [Actinobacteria bacterium]|nr:HD domain-containing protein [Actinomycetota bacterium]